MAVLRVRTRVRGPFSLGRLVAVSVGWSLGGGGGVRGRMKTWFRDTC